jgi:hypothetical protein
MQSHDAVMHTKQTDLMDEHGQQTWRSRRRWDKVRVLVEDEEAAARQVVLLPVAPPRRQDLCVRMCAMV